LRAVWALLLVLGCERGELRFDQGRRECSTERPCPLANLRCLQATGGCVECLQDSDCPAARPTCDGTLHRCVECPGAGACRGRERLCDVGTHRCLVSCDDGRCSDGSAGHCTSDHGLCRACDLDEECSAVSGRPFCQSTIGRCVQCLGDGDCRGATKRCDPLAGACVACLGGADCEAPLACDPATHTCRGA
jgi:hypothetical protein